MKEKSSPTDRRQVVHSRERIIDASIELLDQGGETGLTFRRLSERLATGPGALYAHIANKNDLLTAACDAVIARTISEIARAEPPEEALRKLALRLFDTIDARPWVGSALVQAPGQMPIVRILDFIGQQVRLLRIPEDQQWVTASALLSYIVGVASQNAANAQIGHALGLDRADFLEALATSWSQLDADEFPFARSVASQIPKHDDRADFLEGIDLILLGMAAPSRHSWHGCGCSIITTSNHMKG